jgi:hypothetical protein
MARSGWDDLAVELLGLAGAHQQLLAEHVPVDGFCRGCGQPGYGSPYLRWPCTLRIIAERAAELAATTPSWATAPEVA